MKTITVDRLALLERSGHDRPRLVAAGRVLLASRIDATLVDVGGPKGYMLTDYPRDGFVEPPRFDVVAEAVTGERFMVRGCRPTATYRTAPGRDLVTCCRTVYSR